MLFQSSDVDSVLVCAFWLVVCLFVGLFCIVCSLLVFCLFVLMSRGDGSWYAMMIVLKVTIF
jgi:hypothetical protein